MMNKVIELWETNRTYHDKVFDLSVVIYEADDGKNLIAQCLEHDIAAQSNNIADLKNRFYMTVDFEAEIDGGIERISPAPNRFFEMVEQELARQT